MFLLLTALLSHEAHALDFNVPSAYPTVADAFFAASQAPPGQHRVVLTPGTYILDGPIILDGTDDIVLTTLGQPRPLGDLEDTVPDTVLLFSSFAFTFDSFLGGVFQILGGGSLTLDGVAMYGGEAIWFCDDGLDNDADGLTDASDPDCLPETDTAGEPVTPTPSQRAFTVGVGSTLEIRNTYIEGFTYEFLGGIIYADGGNDIIIRDSVVAGGWAIDEGGCIFARNTPVQVRSSRLSNCGSGNGGAIHGIEATTIDITDSVFDRNSAVAGAAIWIESGSLFVRRTGFFYNKANLVPDGGYGPTINYPNQGGVIFSEDSDLDVANCVFHDALALGAGSAVRIVRANPFGALPSLVNNTFINLLSGSGLGAVTVTDTPFVFTNNAVRGVAGGMFGALGWSQPTPPITNWNAYSEVDQWFTGDLAFYAFSVANNLVQLQGDWDFVGYTFALPDPSGSWDHRNQRFEPRPFSALVDAGDPGILDIGGTRSDIGRYGGPGAGVADADGDGWVTIYDCDDSDNTKYPFAVELCDDLDNNCNGVVDDLETTFYPDLDFDGFGDPAGTTIDACPGDALPDNGGLWVTNNDDCDDTSPRRAPSVAEVCDGLDNDCNGGIDDNIAPREQFIDADRDGFGDGQRLDRVVTASCPPPGFSPLSTDCDDDDPNIHPLITLAEVTLFPVGTAIERSEYDRNPAYVADRIDQDCDGGDLCYADQDGDGRGAEVVPGDIPVFQVDDDLSCANQSSATATTGTDCDDNDPEAYPGASEIPGDGQDQDCSGGDLCYSDADGDGFGDTNLTVSGLGLNCDLEEGKASTPGDCDDGPGGEVAFPGGVEVCDGFDNDCDGTTDELLPGQGVEYFTDQDRDGFGGTEIESGCEADPAPAGLSRQTGDCDDFNNRINPDAVDVCDGIDNDCDNLVDNDETQWITWRRDDDGDGYGKDDDALAERGCEAPSEGTWVPDDGRQPDSNDADPLIGPAATCATVSGGGLGLSWVGLGLLALARRRR